MLVKLYELPPLQPCLDNLKSRGIKIRRPMACETHLLLRWIGEQFEEVWVSETRMALGQDPGGCFVALDKDRKICGFANYDATLRGFFGPTGVAEDMRGQGIGKGLLLACLHAMAGSRYGYAIIGWAGPTEYYARTVGATVIEGSEPGVFRDLIQGLGSSG